MLIPGFGIGSFLGGNVVGDLILFFFLRMRFSGITLAPVPTEKPKHQFVFWDST